MTPSSFLTVNLVSGLAGAGKSSTVRASGGTSIRLTGSDTDAVGRALTDRHHQTPGEVMLEVHPSAVPLEVAISVIAAGGDPMLRPEAGAIRLGNFVSVLDASSFWRDIRSDTLAPEPPVPCATHGEHDRTVADALVQQIEWASVVVINKTDLATAAACADLRDFVRLLNPSSQVVFAQHGHSSVNPWLPPRHDMLRWLQQSPGWIRQLNGEGLLASSRTGLGCVVYRDPRPFHPGRLADFLSDRSTESGEILRSRGLFRLASRPHVVGSWNSGPQHRVRTDRHGQPRPGVAVGPGDRLLRPGPRCGPPHGEPRRLPARRHRVRRRATGVEKPGRPVPGWDLDRDDA